MDCSVLCCIIPGELVSDILTRLSIKSLMRFKAVCKSWNSLTRDPDFVSEHSKVSSAKPRQENMILVHSPHAGDKSSLSVQSEEDSPVTIPFGMEGDRYRLTIIGTCEGLVCVHGARTFRCSAKKRTQNDPNCDPDSDLAFFNPATREVKVIPTSPHPLDPNYGTFGFGYDPETNDYKILILFSVNKIALYSLKNNSWKIVETYTQGLYVHNSPQVYANGFCYWKGPRNNEQDDDQRLITFDMSSEEFGYTVLPSQVPDLRQDRHSHRAINKVKIIAINGYLCLIWAAVEPPQMFTLWVLVNKRWVKGKGIELPKDYYAIDRWWPSLRPKYEFVTVRGNGDIILRNKYDGLLKLYDKSTRKVTPMQSGEGLEVVATLFSLK